MYTIPTKSHDIKKMAEAIELLADMVEELTRYVKVLSDIPQANDEIADIEWIRDQMKQIKDRRG
jgi:hypothetical protein